MQYIKGPLLALGGAGSGKTSLLVHKIAWLIREYDADPARIVVLTYDAHASRLLRGRVADILGRQVPTLRVSTFGEFGLALIQQRLDALGLSAGFSLYDRGDSEAVIGRLLREMRPQYIGLAAAVARQIAAWKRALTAPPAESEAPGPSVPEVAAWLYRRYEQRLRTANAIDFEDLGRKAVRMLTADAELLTEQRARIRFLLVDEYERTTAAEHELVRLVAGDSVILTAAADENQVPGGARSPADNLTRLRSELSELRVINLEQNFRSTARICRAAATLAGARRPIQPPFTVGANAGARLRVMQARTEQIESQGIADALFTHKRRHGADYRDYGILFSRREQAAALERALQERHIPYDLRGGPSFFDQPEVRDLWSYLRLLANPADDIAFLRAINTPRRDIDGATMEQLVRFAAEVGRPLLECALDAELARALVPQRSAVLQDVATLLQALRRHAAHSDPVHLAEELIVELRYEEWLRDTCNDVKIAERRMQNVITLVDKLRRMAKQRPEANLQALVTQLTLRAAFHADENDAAADAVALMPVDSAKGLEFAHVYLVGFEEGLLPGVVETERDIDDERRRAYTAVSCARESLTLTCAEHRRLTGDSAARRPSRFLAELNTDDLEWVGIGDGRSAAEPLLGLAASRRPENTHTRYR